MMKLSLRIDAYCTQHTQYASIRDRRLCRREHRREEVEREADGIGDTVGAWECVQGVCTPIPGKSLFRVYKLIHYTIMARVVRTELLSKYYCLTLNKH